MLRKLRLTLAVLFFVAVTALFLDFTGTVHAWLGWTTKIQFLPALLALNVGVIVALVLLTLLLGRVYCSVICPLGVMQDIVSWISGRRKTKRYRFSYSPEIKWLRYGVLGLFVIALIAGIGSFVALLAPYSSYGRIASNLFAPLYRWGNNLLAYFAERADSYAFYETEVWMKSLPTFGIAALTLVVLAVLAVGCFTGWMDVDTQVARYNVDAYLSGQLTTVDVDHLGGLSEGAVPQLARLLEAPDPQVQAEARAALADMLREHYRVDWENGAIALEPWEEPLLRSWTWTQSQALLEALAPKLQAELQE